MQDQPTALRVPDPGVRDLFTESQRWQSWLDVEVALAQARAAGWGSPERDEPEAGVE